MAERPKHWIKLWVSWLTSRAHAELSEGAFGLGPLLLLLATWDGAYETGGWLLAESGKPMSIDALARQTHRTTKRLLEQLAELVECKTLSIREDGAYGFAKFGHWQETKDAKRMRVKRANNGANSSPECSSDVRADGRRKTEDGRVLASLEPTPTPPREGASSGITTETQAEAERIGGFTLTEPKSEPSKRKAPKPKGAPRLARTDLPDGLAEHVLVRLVQACQDLDGPTAGPRHNAEEPRFLDALRKIQAAHRPTFEDWTDVIRERQRLTQDARAGGAETYGSLTVGSLCAPQNFERWLASSRDRARRNSSATSRPGPAPASPRPTESRTVIVRRGGSDDGQAGAA